MTAPTIGSLFAGIEGFGLAFEREGFELKWSVELNKACHRVLSRHWPHVQHERDVCKVGKHNLSPVDVITFGAPCQDVSVAGKRKGIHGIRSRLFFEAIRIVDELRPTFAVFENVPGLLSSHAGRDFATVLGAFRELGPCDIGWHILDAQYAGVPQRRRRVFLVADFGGDRAGEILFEPKSREGHFTPRRKAGTGSAAQTDGSTGDGGESGSMTPWDAQGKRVFPAEGKWDTLPAGESGGQLQQAVFIDGPNNALTSSMMNVDDNTAAGGYQIPTSETASTLQGGGRRGHRIDAEAAAVGQLVVHRDESLARCKTSSAQRIDAETETFVIQNGIRPREYSEGLGVSKDAPMYTLDTFGEHAVGVFPKGDAECLTGERTHALTSEGADAGEDGGGRGTPIVPAVMAFDTAQITSNVNRTCVEPGLPSSTRASNSNMHVAFGVDGEETGFALRANPSASGDKGEGGMNTTTVLHPSYGVRRLMPVECEKLQGFPPDWTAVDAEGIAISDAARYRMLGNAVAVPCVQPIARRIRMALDGAFDIEAAS